MLLWRFSLTPSSSHYEDLHLWSIILVADKLDDLHVINNALQVRENYTCNQAQIVGFGDNDHAIRNIMGFIERCGRLNETSDYIHYCSAPNHLRRFNFILHFEIEYRKVVLSGDIFHKLECKIVCSNSTTNIQMA
jgi:hypothetical protein